MYKSLTKTKKKYSELEAHETLKRVASAKCNNKTLRKFFFNNCKTPCDGSKLFKKLTIGVTDRSCEIT